MVGVANVQNWINDVWITGGYIGGLPFKSGLYYNCPDFMGAGFAMPGFLLLSFIVIRKNIVLKN